MNINQAFEAALSGTLTQGDILKLLCSVAETSAEVKRVEQSIAARHPELIGPFRPMTDDEMSAAYEAGNRSIYADQANGWTLD